MGLFSIYTGLIYNDIFSKSINVFGSHWNVRAYNKSTVESNEHLILNPSSSDYVQLPYPFGLDPVWQVKEFINKWILVLFLLEKLKSLVTYSKSYQ